MAETRQACSVSNQQPPKLKEIADDRFNIVQLRHKFAKTDKTNLLFSQVYKLYKKGKRQIPRKFKSGI